MTLLKTRWSDLPGLEDEDGGETANVPRPVKSRVIHGGQYETVGSTVHSARTSSRVPKAVALGRIQLAESENRSVRLDYEPQRYGIGQVETLEEREERYSREVARLKQEADAREKAAYERGLEEGKRAGYDEGLKEVEGSIAQISQLLEAVQAATRAYYQKVEQRLVQFAMLIARKVVGDTAENYREVAVKLAAQAIEQATDRTRILLLVNQVDFERLKNAKADLRAVSEGIKEVEVEVSPRVSPGSVILETGGSSIDATIETMLDEVHKALLPEVDDRRDEENGG